MVVGVPCICRGDVHSEDRMERLVCGHAACLRGDDQMAACRQGT